MVTVYLSGVAHEIKEADGIGFDRDGDLGVWVLEDGKPHHQVALFKAGHWQGFSGAKTIEDLVPLGFKARRDGGPR